MAVHSRREQTRAVRNPAKSSFAPSLAKQNHVCANGILEKPLCSERVHAFTHRQQSKPAAVPSKSKVINAL